MMPFYFGTNFKMYQTPDVSRRFVTDLIEKGSDIGAAVQRFVIPPFTSLQGLPALAHEGGVWVGAQNMHHADEGAYTGEISPKMLAALGLDMVMLGHAERRQHFGETDEALNKKVHAAHRHGLKVLLCVGEDAREKHFGVERETVARQLKTDLHEAPAEIDLMIAYEPVWSIGAGGTPATVADVLYTVRGIHYTLADIFGQERAAQIPVLYGGSVNADNCGEYARLKEIHGLFVGRAAREVDGYLGVLRAALKARGT